MEIKDRIYILGTGAIGIALAINLLLNKRRVILVKTSRDDISEKSIEISMKNINGEIIRLPVGLVSLKKLSKISGIIVITSKSYANVNIALLLKEKQTNSPIIVMQNGLGIEKPFLEMDFQEIYRCILFATSQVLDENFVQYKPVAPSPIGIIKGNITNLSKIVELLDTPGFQVIFEGNIQEVIWKKAIINSVFNSLCPLLDIDNGIFHRNKEVMRIAIKIVDECVLVARSTGVTLSNDELHNQILNISKLSDGQSISTLQDIQNKRKTEINSLNLEIVRIAENLNPKVSTMITQLLGNLILLKSEMQLS